ncbi:hypothetical protein [Zooshikella sp. RANM57]|uniref:hypothetical protein n=1 Tax=Zooshikella sp. RANM57 TaxID=3425863 RepID=UPI003D6F3467
MKKIISALLFSLPISGFCSEINGVDFPDGNLSFADKLVSYSPGSGVTTPYTNGQNAIDIPDYVSGGSPEYVSLGDQGEIIVQFTNNSLTTSGDSSSDLWIFEVGNVLEPTDIYISENGSKWIYVGSTSGGKGGIDIDAYLNNGVSHNTKYNFVKVVDLLPTQSGSPWAGADIDAIGAISSSEGVCGKNEALSPATYDKNTGKLYIPYVIAGEKCYELELNGTEGIDIELVETYLKSKIENK